MRTVILEQPIRAEGHCLPAGTPCVVEHEYADGILDLRAVWGDEEILFWVRKGEVHPAD